MAVLDLGNRIAAARAGDPDAIAALPDDAAILLDAARRVVTYYLVSEGGILMDKEGHGLMANLVDAVE